MKPVYTLLIILAILATMWTAAAVRIPDPKPAASSTLNAESLDTIRPGMTLEEVTFALGSSPVESEPLKGHIAVNQSEGQYRWANEKNGLFIKTTFTNGRLTTFTHNRR